MTDVLCQSASDLGYEPGSLKARIAAASEASCEKHRGDLPPLPMGSSARDWKRANKRRSKILKAEVKADVYPQFKDEQVPAGETPPRDMPETDDAGEPFQPGQPCGFLFAFLTLGWLLEVVVSAVISWWIEKKLSEHFDK